MSVSQLLDLIEKAIGQRPQLSPESHLPLDLHLQRFMVPPHDEKARYHAEGEEIVALNLSGLGLVKEKLSFLEEMNDLKALNLSNNALTSYQIPKNLSGLVYLELSDHEALASVIFPVAFPKLKRLNLSNTGLETVTFQEGFKSLEILELQKNKLKELHLPEGFDSLVFIDLKDNAIATFKAEGEFPKLYTLYLENNKLTEIDKDFLLPFPRLARLRLEGNPLPETVLSNIGENSTKTWAVIHRYIEDLKGGTDQDRECKVLLLGNGNVGKTCLVQRLVYNQFEKDWLSTHAISLEQFPPADKTKIVEPIVIEEAAKLVEPYLLNLWDFGGQDIYHATHRLFMQENAVYLILWDAKTETEDYTYRIEQEEVREYENHKLKYWLSYAKSQGKNSPVIVVQTKMEEHTKLEPIGGVRAAFTPKFSRLEFHHIESSDDNWKTNGYLRLLREVRDSVEVIKTRSNKTQAKIPTFWVNIRREIRNLQRAGKKRLELKEFYHLAIKVKEPMDVLRWLTQSGVVFYKEGLFNNEIILDQGWVIETVYTLFDRDDPENSYYYFLENKKGEFSGQDLARIWKKNSEAERELFLSFMISCELCFETTPEDKERYHTPFAARTFIAPQLLPRKADTHELIWEDKEVLYLRLEHEFLHYGVIQSFIVRVQKWGLSRDIWKTGVLLKLDNQMAQVEAGKDVVLVKATKGSEKLLAKIRSELTNVQGEKATSLASYDGENYALLSDIEEMLSRNRNKEIKCVNGTHVAIEGFSVLFNKIQPLREHVEMVTDENFIAKQYEAEILSKKEPFVMPKKDLPKVYFSYAWGDPREEGDSREDIVNVMYRELEKEKNYQLLRDKMNISYGELISSFMKALGEGDLIVVFLSDKYICSKYCMFELYEIARNNKFDMKLFSQRVLPVRVEALRLDDPDIIDNYFVHWESENKKWSNLVKKRIDSGNPSESLNKQLMIVNDIEKKFGDLVFWIQNINASTLKLLSQNDYQRVKEAIEKRLESKGRV